MLHKCFKCRLNLTQHSCMLEKHDKQTNKSWDFNMLSRTPIYFVLNGSNSTDAFLSWCFSAVATLGACFMFFITFVLQDIWTNKPRFWQLEKTLFGTTWFHYFRASVHQHTSGWMRPKEFRCTQSRRRAAAGHSHCVPCSYTTWLDLSKAGVAKPCDTAFAVTLGSLLFHRLSFVMHS